jgi:hypothetical protein
MENYLQEPVLLDLREEMVDTSDAGEADPRTCFSAPRTELAAGVHARPAEELARGSHAPSEAPPLVGPASSLA